MSDFLAAISRSEPFQILSGVSIMVSLLYEVYLRLVIRRVRHAPVLGEELDAFFKRIQGKWADSPNRVER